MSVASEGATIVREHQGFYYNVLVYKERCDACGYCAPTNSFAVAELTCGTYDTPGFVCPSCDNCQTVGVQVELREEVAGFLITEQ